MPDIPPPPPKINQIPPPPGTLDLEIPDNYLREFMPDDLEFQERFNGSAYLSAMLGLPRDRTFKHYNALVEEITQAPANIKQAGKQIKDAHTAGWLQDEIDRMWFKAANTVTKDDL